MPGNEAGTTNTYECVDCADRVTASSRPGECERCGGEMMNLSTPRER